LTQTPQLSVVVPVFNEQDNVGPLLQEIVAALRGRIDFEAVFVDDDSKDGTLVVFQPARCISAGR
jgi:dolichol-phosphate mannosyltransferase